MKGYEGPGTGHDVGRYVGVTMRETDELHLVGHASVAPHLRGPDGGVRTGALLTMLDNVGFAFHAMAAAQDFGQRPSVASFLLIGFAFDILAQRLDSRGMVAEPCIDKAEIEPSGGIVAVFLRPKLKDALNIGQPPGCSVR